MQWSLTTEEKQQNQLVQAEFHFITTRVTIKAAAITRYPSPPHQRCTGAKDGKFQGGLFEQSNAVEFVC
jgi:hypothetical protein